MYLQRKGNKYNNCSKIFDGRSYMSKKEAAYAQDLDLLIKAGEIKEVVPQYRLDLKAYGKHICNYYVDFKVITNTDSIEYHEVKGFETEVWRLKWKLAEAMLGEIEPDSKLVVIK